MESGDFGESSCRKKPNNDKMSDTERPLKKAKFAWQVKGRFNNNIKDQDNAIETNSPENISITSSSIVNEVNENNSVEPEITSKAEENLEILGDYLLKQDFSILNPLILDQTAEKNDYVDKSKDDSSSNCSTSLSYPKYTPSNENVPITSNNSDNNLASSNTMIYKPDDIDNSANNPPSMVQQRNSKTEDQYLARWQARQIAKGFVDNTINRVLDSWLIAPLPQTYDDTQNLALDVAEFLDNLPANNAVENEGILMAISAHGLQNNQSGARSNHFHLQHQNFGSRIAIAISERVSRSDPNSETFLEQIIQNSNTLDAENQNQEMNEPSPSHISNNLLKSESKNENNKDSHEPTSSCSHVKNNSNDGSKPVSLPNVSTDNAFETSSQSSSWRYFPQPCHCSHSTRRTNTTPNIPFHQRDNIDYFSRSDILISDPEQNYIPSDMPKESKNENDQDLDTKSNGSTNEEDCQDISDSAPNLYPTPSESHQEYEEHFDFMDAAVSFAIQNKGLTSFSSVDYG